MFNIERLIFHYCYSASIYMYLICTSSVWSISFVSSNIKGVVAVFCIEAWRVTSAIICQMWPLPIFLFQINSCQEFCSFLPIHILNSRVQVRLLNVIERSCPIIWRPMVWHQSESSVYVPPLNRTAAAERRLTSGIPLTSGEDVQVPQNQRWSSMKSVSHTSGKI